MKFSSTDKGSISDVTDSTEFPNWNLDFNENPIAIEQSPSPSDITYKHSHQNLT